MKTKNNKIKLKQLKHKKKSMSSIKKNLFKKSFKITYCLYFASFIPPLLFFFYINNYYIFIFKSTNFFLSLSLSHYKKEEKIE